jgi:hypothetical protein
MYGAGIATAHIPSGGVVGNQQGEAVQEGYDMKVMKKSTPLRS